MDDFRWLDPHDAIFVSAAREALKMERRARALAAADATRVRRFIGAAREALREGKPRRALAILESCPRVTDPPSEHEILLQEVGPGNVRPPPEIEGRRGERVDGARCVPRDGQAG